MEIRDSVPEDFPLIRELYPDAFPDEDLLPLVGELLGETGIVRSLVAVAKETLLGHVIFTACGLVGKADRVALLGPLAVASTQQRQGVGSALVRAGLQREEKASTLRAFVLGDPSYYARFGFATDEDIAPPYPLPDEWRGAWQSLGLSGNEQPLHGTLSVPGPWQHRALWAP